MGRARLLCPRPQPDRLRPGGGGARRLSRRAKPGCAHFPGIGDYTAAAIAAIAFGRDGDAGRHQCRAGDRAAQRRRPDKARRSAPPRRPWCPAGQARRFRAGDDGPGRDHLPPAQSRLPGTARCEAIAAPSPRQARGFPASKAARKARPLRHGVAQWIERDGAVWLVRRPAKGLLGGMAALPGPEWGERRLPSSERWPTVRHGFTHFDARPARRRAAALPPGEGWWQPTRPARRGGPADPVSPRRSRRCLRKGRSLPPEPFFAGPGHRPRRRASQPARANRRAASPRPTRARWCGTMACPRSTQTGG